jgi:hypothetical protein
MLGALGLYSFSPALSEAGLQQFDAFVEGHQVYLFQSPDLKSQSWNKRPIGLKIYYLGFERFFWRAGALRPATLPSLSGDSIKTAE